MLAAVEAGGTKFRVAVLDREFEIVAQEWIPTTSPEETIGACASFFADHEVSALGIASFGPLVVDRSSPDYGSISATPKRGWSGAALLGRLQAALDVPADMQTDVEAAAVAESRLGAGKGYSLVGYVTVGTGVGAAVAVDGIAYRGRTHTELGHIPVRRADGDSFAGVCPFHSDCLEGMASGPAIARRCGADPTELDGRDGLWDLEASYLAQLVRVLTLSFAPDVVLFGGGVGARPDMAERISKAVEVDLAGYAEGPPTIATAGLGGDAGLVGAALIAADLTD